MTSCRGAGVRKRADDNGNEGYRQSVARTKERLDSCKDEEEKEDRKLKSRGRKSG